MTSRFMTFRFAVILLSVSASGCLGVSEQAVTIVDYLDPKTVDTVTHLSEPVVFAREEPSVAVNVRDYLYVGPLEINRTGEISYYLWLGEWSTIDRLPENGGDSAGPAADAPAYAVVLWIDGQPAALSDSRLPTLGRMPYTGPVDSLRPSFHRVSRDQLARMASAESIAVQLRGVAGSRRYRLWSGNPATFAMISDLRATLD